MDFTAIPNGCLEEGTETPLGVIEAVSLTAYLIDGRWVPFQRIHGKPRKAEALAVPQEWVDAVTPAMSRQFEAMNALAIDILTGGAK
jgi:hypothetical protein